MMDFAKDKIMMGVERRSLILNDETKELQPTMKLAMQ